MKKSIGLLFLLITAVGAAERFDPISRPDAERYKAFREARKEMANPPDSDMMTAMAADAGSGVEQQNVLVLLVEFGGTNTFTWTPGESTWDPLGYRDISEWDGTNYGNSAASQFFADYHGITGPTNFTYSGPLHNEIPRLPSGDQSDLRWNSIWRPDFSKSYYEQMLFGNGVVYDFYREDGSHFYADHTGVSVSNYYAEMSGGKLAVSGDVYGWITLTNSIMYYGADEVPGRNSVGSELKSELASSGSIPDAGGNISLVEDACRAAEQLYPEINWADYDLDGDGIVDALWIIVAGIDQADAIVYDNSFQPENKMWAHKSQSRNPIEIADGISIKAFTTLMEDCGIYAVSHEYGHALGAVDLYSYSGGYISPLQWCLMASSQFGFPSSFIGGVMDPYHLDGWGWLDPFSVINPAQVETVELYQAGSGLDVPTGMHRAARIRLEDQQLTLQVQPPDGASTCWWGGNDLNSIQTLSLNSALWVGGSNATLSLNTAYELENEADFLAVAVTYTEDGGVTWSPLYFLTNEATFVSSAFTNFSEYGGFSFEPPFTGLTGTSPGYPDYHTETYSLSAFSGKVISFIVAYVTESLFPLGGPFVGSITIDTNTDPTPPYVWSADDPQTIQSTWHTVDGTHPFPHYYYLQWRNTGSDGGYDSVLSYSNNPFGQHTSGLLTWYVNERYQNNNVEDYLEDFPSYGSKGVALVVDAHPSVFRFGQYYGRPCTNALVNFHNYRHNTDAAFGYRTTSLMMDGESGALPGRPFFTDSRNYNAGVEYTYLNPLSVPPQFEWVARNYSGGVVTPSRSRYGCSAPDMPDQTDIYRIWPDAGGRIGQAVETAGAPGGIGNPIEVDGQYGWNFQVLEDRGTSAVVRIWNSHYSGPYPVLVDVVGGGTTAPSDDFLVEANSNAVVEITADEDYLISKVMHNGTEVPAAVGLSSYTLNLGPVTTNSSVYAFFTPEYVAGSTVPKHWFTGQGIPLTPTVLTDDFDQDGISNEDEYFAGTLANDASSCLRMKQPDASPGTEMSWVSEWNHWYTLEMSTNLLTTPFNPISGPIPGNYDETSCPVSLPTNSPAFYRVRLADPAN